MQPPVQPEPFALVTERRGEVAKAQLLAKAQQQHEEELRRANFKAHPVPMCVLSE